MRSQPWGATQWERLAEGESFDGMESWLPYVHPDEDVLPDLLPPGSQVVLVEPRRIRDRAVQLLDEEAALAEALAKTWGAEDGPTRGFPRLHLPFERLLADSPRPVSWPCRRRPEGPSTPVDDRARFRPGGRRSGPAGRPGERPGRATTTPSRCARPPRAGAERLSAVLGEGGMHAPTPEAASGAPGAVVVTAALSSGFILPDSKVAVLAESDITGRRMPHRRARPRARATDGFFDDLAIGSFVVHRQHGVARFEGVTSRTMAGTTRDYLILQYRGNDRLYLPVDQIEAITAYSGGETPTLSKMGGSDWQRTRAKASAAASEVAEELVKLYRLRLEVEGFAFSPDTPWQTEMESSFGFVETEDQLKAIADVKADMERPAADGPADLRRRGIRQDRGLGARRVQGGPGREAGRRAGTDHVVGQPARADVRRSLRALSGAGGAPQSLPVAAPTAQGDRGPGRRQRRRGDRDASTPRPGRDLQAARRPGRRRGTAIRGDPQGGGQAALRRGRRLDLDRQPHPADLGDGADRDPRSVHGQHPAGRPPPHPHLCRRT